MQLKQKLSLPPPIALHCLVVQVLKSGCSWLMLWNLILFNQNQSLPWCWQWELL